MGRDSGFYGGGAHTIARCTACQYGPYKCGRPAGAPYHQARGFGVTGGAQPGSQRTPGCSIELKPISRMRPDWEWDSATYQKKQRDFICGLEPCCDQRGWEAEMSKFNKNLRRYRLPKGHTCHGCVLPSGTIEDGIHLLVRLHPRRGARIVLTEYTRLRNIAGHLCAHNLRKLLKESTGWLKLGGRFISSLCVS